MSKSLADKARNRRIRALRIVRQSNVNLFWDDRAAPRMSHSVIAHLTDVRIRMGDRRLCIAPPAD